MIAIFGNELAHPDALTVLALPSIPAGGTQSVHRRHRRRAVPSGRKCNIQIGAAMIYQAL